MYSVTCRAQAFNDERRSWQTLNKELAARDAIPTFRDGRAYQVEVRSDWELIAHGLLWRVTLNVSGGGDVDGDGLEDLIIERQIEYDMKGYSTNEIFALTRESSDGPLRVINADDILDPDQPCGGAYAQGGHYWKTSRHCAMSDDEISAISSLDQDQATVWWSNDLRLDDLSLIDARLKQPFEDFGGDALAMDTWPESENGHVHAKTCQELFDYLGQDYGFVSDHDLGAWQVKRCEAIRKLKQAQPATISHLTDFTINKTTVGQLPALVDHVILGSFVCYRYLYNQARFTWLEFGTPGGLEGIEALNVSEDTFRILRVSDHEVLAVNDKEAAHLKVVAGGDFNGDGLDDILLETTFWKDPAETYDPLTFDLRQFLKTGQFWVTSELYVLSRDCPEGPLWMIDAEKHLGPSGRCDDWFAETEWIATHW